MTLILAYFVRIGHWRHKMNKYLELIGISVIFASYFMVLSTLVFAMLNGGEILINVNNYNEGLLEIVLMVLVFPIILSICIKRIKEIKNL